MLPKAELAYFAIADISGYTNFLAGVELDHAQDIIADFMDTVVKGLRPPFRLAKFEATPPSSTPWPRKSTARSYRTLSSQPILNSVAGCETSGRARLASAKPVLR